MPSVDIANQTARVGAALVSVPLHRMILELAKGIAWGQYELDKVGVDVTKLMGVPGTVNIGGEKLSMLESGFLPSFYHFVDSILELKMEVKIREEQKSHLNYKDTKKLGVSTDVKTEVGAKAKGSVGYGPVSGSVEASFKAHYQVKTEAVYTKSIDAGYSQQFSQELNASSLMRTKLVPKPPPELLVERVRILLDKLRKEAEDEVNANPPADQSIEDAIEDMLMHKIEEKLLGAPEEHLESKTDSDDTQSDDSQSGDTTSGA